MSALKKGTRVTIKNTSFFKSQKEPFGFIEGYGKGWYTVRWVSGIRYGYQERDIVVIDFNVYKELCEKD